MTASASGSVRTGRATTTGISRQTCSGISGCRTSGQYSERPVSASIFTKAITSTSGRPSEPGGATTSPPTSRSRCAWAIRYRRSASRSCSEASARVLLLSWSNAELLTELGGPGPRLTTDWPSYDTATRAARAIPDRGHAERWAMALLGRGTHQVDDVRQRVVVAVFVDRAPGSDDPDGVVAGSRDQIVSLRERVLVELDAGRRMLVDDVVSLERDALQDAAFLARALVKTVARGIDQREDLAVAFGA